MPVRTDPPWVLTGPAFARLLQRLGSEPEAAAREYDAVRHRLVGFFERRGVPSPEALADETIDRVARRLDEGEAIEHLNAYFYGVARRVVLEWRKRWARERAAERAYPRAGPEAASAESESRIACLECCLRALPDESRALLIAYYRGRGEERKRLAESHGITYTSLKTRACRLRVRLEVCLRDCLEGRRAVTDDGPGALGPRHR
jgi:DNA-directed RNA polymerase specialized sigma24 family protein